MVNVITSTNYIDKQAALNEAQPHLQVQSDLIKVIKIEPGVHYLLAQKVMGKNELLKELVALRKGGDLIIFHADGSQIIFADYYFFCAPSDNTEQVTQEACSVTVAGKDGGEHTFTSENSTHNNFTATDVSFIVYTQGSQASLEEITQMGSYVQGLMPVATEPEQSAESGSIFGYMAVPLGGALLAAGGSTAADALTTFAMSTPAPTKAVTELTLSGGAIGTVTYTLEGDDAADFTVDSGTGVVSMVARDFENSADSDMDNVYNYTLKATDADGNTAGGDRHGCD